MVAATKLVNNGSMQNKNCATRWHRSIAVVCSALLAWCALTVHAQTPAPFKLRVVGGLAGLSQFTRWEEPFWTKDLQRLSGGKYSADVVPFDRAGVPGVEMLRLLQLGVVPFGTTLLSSLTAQFPQYTAPDLAGLNPDMANLKRSLAAFRPYLEKSLREQHGIEALAFYTYPAQVVFCKAPIANLSELSGRRVRVSSAGQADFVGALGGVPVNTAFAQMVGSFQAGNIDCAITGTLSGFTVGLPGMTSYLYPMPVTWGVAIFAANLAAWEALPPDLRALLRRELPKLEASIWEQSSKDTLEGIACSTGTSGCTLPNKGAMTLVPVSAQDERRRQEIFKSSVLPRWLQRCGPRCVEIWNKTLGPDRGIPAPTSP